MSPPLAPDRVEFELRDYFHVIRRRWKILAVCIILVTAAGLGLSLRKPEVYEASAGVLLDTGFSRTVLFTNATNIPNIDEQVTTETDLMNSYQVQQAIQNILGYLPDVTIRTDAQISTSASKNLKTRTIYVTAKEPTPAEAQKAADDFSRAYITVRKSLITEDLKSKIAENNQALNDLDVSTAQANAQIAQIQAQIEATTGEPQRVLQARRDRLAARASSDAVNARQSDILTRQDQLQTALINNQGSSIFKRNLASLPTSPSSPRPIRDGSIALFIGLVIGLIAAFLRDYSDDTIRTKEDIARIAGGVPVLGIIPMVKLWRNKKEAVLESSIRPGSASAEAYRGLRTALEFTGVGRELRLIHVTSSEPGEGKSTTAANMAVSLARAGRDVVLVDCDLRRPRAHEFFGLDNSVGFTTLLLGTTTVEQSLQRIPDIPGLFVVPSGPLPPNPAELLDSDVTRTRLELLAKSADYVIVDSPPLLPVADSVVLASHAHATILVVMARKARRRSIARSLELLAQVDVPVAGIVLNGVGDEGTYGYGYGYGYGYQKDDPRFDPRLWRKSREVLNTVPHDLGSRTELTGDQTPKVQSPDAVDD